MLGVLPGHSVQLSAQPYHGLEEDVVALWDGLDGAPKLQLAGANASSRALYALLGPMDSGTNLLEIMIEANWPGMFRSTNEPQRLWKHSLGTAEELYSFFDNHMPDVPINSVNLVMAVRSPISQVASWIGAPDDHLSLCVHRQFAKFSKPCFAQLQIRANGAPAKDKPRMIFNSTMDVYNQYLTLYRRLLEDRRFKGAQIVHYEDMVLAPEGVVASLAEMLNAPVQTHSGQVAVPDKYAKPTELPLPRVRAMSKLRKRAYLQSLDRKVVHTLCSLLNTTLVSDMMESQHVPDDQMLSYTYDCSTSSSFL